MQGIIDNYTARYRSQGKPDWRQWLMDQGHRLSKQEPIYSPIRLPVEELKEVLTHLGEPSYQEVATTAFISEYLLGLGLKLRKEDKLAENETEKLILDVLVQGALYIDNIIKHTKLSAPKVATTLALMEISGKIRNLGGNVYSLN
jgi:predicted Rossmann fold nucleotide-binding protein DprA/Smf involved in DNA uptake